MRNCGKARRARKAIMLDNSVGESIIEVVGGEDTALLRSNPSARTDAGIAAEGYSLKCLPPPVRSNDPGHKAANLGVWGGAPIQKTVFSACPACHLARSPGLNRFRAYSHGLRRGLFSFALRAADPLPLDAPHFTFITNTVWSSKAVVENLSRSSKIAATSSPAGLWQRARTTCARRPRP